MPTVEEIMEMISEDDPVDRGWMLIERDAINHSKITRGLQYIHENLDENDELILDEFGSQLMADATGEHSGQKIRRHIILQLTTLGLITRDITTRDWIIKIPNIGKRYLFHRNRRLIFQKEIIEKLIFCRPEWSTPERARTYDDYDINPYNAVIFILDRVGGRVYLEEMTYFISKAKSMDDLPQIIEKILSYRRLSPEQKRELVTRLKGIINVDVPDKFGNWRKHNKRSFELLSMGTELTLSYTSDDEFDTFPLIRQSEIDEDDPFNEYVNQVIERNPFDGVIEINRDNTEFNNGLEGENIVSSLLEKFGFIIINVTGSKKGYDLLAIKNNVKFLVEVKSSVKICHPTLTENEYLMAERYGEVYILAIVENVNASPSVYFVTDPVGQIGENIQRRNTTSYFINKDGWSPFAQEMI